MLAFLYNVQYFYQHLVDTAAGIVFVAVVVDDDDDDAAAAAVDAATFCSPRHLLPEAPHTQHLNAGETHWQ